MLDDVFAELDSERRSQLAGLVAGAEQVLVTAAVVWAVARRRAWPFWLLVLVAAPVFWVLRALVVVL